jgi:hypothetical protein
LNAPRAQRNFVAEPSQIGEAQCAGFQRKLRRDESRHFNLVASDSLSLPRSDQYLNSGMAVS